MYTVIRHRATHDWLQSHETKLNADDEKITETRRRLSFAIAVEVAAAAERTRRNVHSICHNSYRPSSTCDDYLRDTIVWKKIVRYNQPPPISCFISYALLSWWLFTSAFTPSSHYHYHHQVPHYVSVYFTQLFSSLLVFLYDTYCGFLALYSVVCSTLGSKSYSA